MTWLLSAALIAGCQPTGPRNVARDRMDYSDAIGTSWKRQVLLNIVKLRYLDTPIFVDVGQIVAGYSRETSVSVNGEFAEEGAGDRFFGVGGRSVFTDRPTITYAPLTGNRFIKSLMMPLAPDSVFFLIESGWPADAVLFATLRSINGLKNQESNIEGTSAPNPQLLRALALMRSLQMAGGLALRVQQDAQKQETAFLLFRSQNNSPEALSDAAELRRLLRLEADAEQYKLVFGPNATDGREIAVLTRSVLQLMQAMAAQVEVPAGHLKEHRVPPGWESAGGAQREMRMINICSSVRRPLDAYAAVSYRGHWFWIEDRDLKSKRAFSFMMALFTLAETGETEPLPLITIPAQ